MYAMRIRFFVLSIFLVLLLSTWVSCSPPSSPGETVLRDGSTTQEIVLRDASTVQEAELEDGSTTQETVVADEPQSIYPEYMRASWLKTCRAFCNAIATLSCYSSEEQDCMKTCLEKDDLINPFKPGGRCHTASDEFFACYTKKEHWECKEGQPKLIESNCKSLFDRAMNPYIKGGCGEIRATCGSYCHGLAGMNCSKPSLGECLETCFDTYQTKTKCNAEYNAWYSCFARSMESLPDKTWVLTGYECREGKAQPKANVCTKEQAALNVCKSCQQDRSPCGNLCVDLQSDKNHCGSCNKVCGSTQLCWAGSCIDCTKDSQCKSGETCKSGLCVLKGHCKSQTDCDKLEVCVAVGQGSSGVCLRGCNIDENCPVKQVNSKPFQLVCRKGVASNPGTGVCVLDCNKTQGACPAGETCRTFGKQKICAP